MAKTGLDRNNERRLILVAQDGMDVYLRGIFPAPTLPERHDVTHHEAHFFARLAPEASGDRVPAAIR